MPEVGFFAMIVGAILAIVFGTIGLHQAKHHPDRYGGRTLALVGLVLGIIELAVAVVLVIVVVILVAAVAAALAAVCASCGTSNSQQIVAAVVDGPRRAQLRWGPVLRFALSHHPACVHYANDVVPVSGWPICQGCLVTGSSAALTWMGLLASPPASWAWTLAAGIMFGSVQFVSVLGYARSRASKIAVKVPLGVGLALVLHGVLAAPWDWPLRLAVLGGGWMLAFAAMQPRGRRHRAHVHA